MEERPCLVLEMDFIILNFILGVYVYGYCVCVCGGVWVWLGGVGVGLRQGFSVYKNIKTKKKRIKRRWDS